MVSVQPLPLSLCSKLPLAAAQAMAMCTSMYLHAWGEKGGVSGPAPDTALGCQPPLPALLHHHNLTPHSCSLKQKQPLAFPPPLCSIWLTTLQGLLGSLSCVHFVSGVPSVNSLHPSRPLPGALSALPSTVGGPQHSSVGFTGKVAPAVDFQSLSQTAQGFL